MKRTVKKIVPTASQQSTIINRLGFSTSPYLQQHKYDKIDWFPWSDEAIEKAQSLDKPVFLSIGYSSCHWCHVQHHLSFQNDEIVDILNENFICIKVDKEQRPDIDAMYMGFVLQITGGAGHPMSIFTTPTMKPIYGGTYFPPETFKSLLINVSDKWELNKKDLIESADNVHRALSKGDDYSHVKYDPNTNVGNKLMDFYLSKFDQTNGGFSKEPKFPTVPQLTTLLRIGIGAIPNVQQDRQFAAFAMLTKTLHKISLGGIHDHVEGGFHRYSVDATWHVPHFEKMLYDQAQLLEIYATTAILAKQRGDTRHQIFVDVVNDIYKYTFKWLKSSDGGYFTAEDADSEPTKDAIKVEGAFCVWTDSELQNLLKNDYSMYKAFYGVESDGNVPLKYDIQQELVGKNILMQQMTFEELSDEFKVPVADCISAINKSNAILRNERELVRPRPFRDEKIVTVWNGMMVSGLIAAYKATNNEAYVRDATALLDFIFKRLTIPNSNKLWRDFKHDQEPTTKGFSDDYASVIKACIDMYLLTLNSLYLNQAIGYQTILDATFWDFENGGYFTSMDDKYVIKSKDIQDGAEPSGQTVELDNLMRLSMITSDLKYLEKSEKLKELYKGLVYQMPHALIGFSGIYATEYKSYSVSRKDGILVKDKMSKIDPIVIHIDESLDGYYVECSGNICEGKKSIKEF